MESLSIGAGPLNISYNGRDPDSVETHPLDVVEMTGYPFPCPATVLSVGRVASGSLIVRSGESIGQNLQMPTHR